MVSQNWYKFQIVLSMLRALNNYLASIFSPFASEIQESTLIIQVFESVIFL